MRKTYFSITSLAFLILSTVFTGCAAQPTAVPPTQLPSPTSTTPADNGSDPGTDLVISSVARAQNLKIPESDQQQLAAGNRAFAADLYQRLRMEEGNLFFSPYSISLALAMTYAGAGGETSSQMAEVMHYSLPAAQLHPAFNSLDQYLQSLGRASESAQPTSDFQPTGQGFQLDIANAVWGQKGKDFLPAYLDLLAANYGAGMRLADFAGSPEPSRQAINEWVSQQTKEKIQDLFPQGTIDASTRLALVNAVYFKASWAFPFNASQTKDEPFTRLDGSQVSVPMMFSGEAAKEYYRGENYQAVELGYFDQKAGMIVILPDAGKFAEVEASLNPATLDTIREGLQFSHVDLALPKFKVESSFSLADTLAEMGMPAAFNPGPADFSGMDGQHDLYISAVQHKAYVAVDEQGTEAAAATGVAVALGAVLNPTVVHVDRPFIYLIIEPQSGTILFMGRVLDPTK